MRRLLLVLLLLASLTLVARGVLPCSALQFQPSCYAALYPGPTADTLDIVDIADAQTFPTTGDLLLTTVAVEGDLDLREWISTAVSDRIEQVPREAILGSDSDAEDVARENVVLMESSQTDATIAGLLALDFDVDQMPDGARVAEIAQTTAFPEGDLSVGDVITAIDGSALASAQEAVDLLRERAPGDLVRFSIDRDGAQREVEVTLIASPEDAARPFLGVFLSDHLELPVDVRIDAGSIGGPSAGLMFALGIVDLLQADDLTGGRIVAGTGTIDRMGNIGPVGGIRQKVLGATEPVGDAAAATVFLAPAGANFDEASAAPVTEDVLLVPVATLDEAIAALRDLDGGRDPAGALALGPGGS